MLELQDRQTDVGKTFQRRDANRPEAYEFFANLFLYSIDKSSVRFKGDAYVVTPNPSATPTKTISVARLKYDGSWNPEPAGWKRLAAVMRNQNRVNLQARPVELGKDSLDAFTIAHLTGTDAFKLDSMQQTALRDFVKKGGLLIVDSCGGQNAFNGAAQTELSRLFPDQMAQLGTPLPKDHPLYRLDHRSDLIAKYRVYTLIKRSTGANGFRLNGLQCGGKLGVIYTSDDLSEGLVGQAVDGIIGYTPEVATTLMQRIVLLKAAGKI